MTRQSTFRLMLVAVTTLLLASCKKDYTCTCTTTFSNGSAVGQTTETYTVSKNNRSKARKDCQDDSATADGETKTCDLQ